MPDEHTWYRRSLGALIVVGIILVALYVGSTWFGGRSINQLILKETPAGFPAYAPTPVRADLARTQRGFDYFVSHTDRGFEPSTLSIDRGKTVRFTNNASDELWIVPVGSIPDSPCATGDLNTCRALGAGEYWEYTFSTAGTWEFSNTTTGSTGVIIVQ